MGNHNQCQESVPSCGFGSRNQCPNYDSECCQEFQCQPTTPVAIVDSQHVLSHRSGMPEQSGVQAMLDAASSPLSFPTTAAMQDQWYKNGGMPAVMDNYYDHHMTHNTGVLKRLGLTHNQMQIVRQQVDASGQLQQLLETRIHQSIAVDSRYTSWEAVTKAMANDCFVLLRGDWLIQAASVNFLPLPRRQQLLEDSVWDHECLAGRLAQPDETGPVAVVAVLYHWLSTEHPDPDGVYLRILSVLVSAAAKHLKTWGTAIIEAHEILPYAVSATIQTEKDVALFFDWCSMHQPPRTELHEEVFQASLKDVDLWFVHRGIHSWILHEKDDLPVPRYLRDAVSQFHRRWPAFEFFLSTLIKDPDMILWAGPLPPYWTWEDVQLHCKTTRFPPLRPEKMADVLALQVMAAAENDCTFLIQRYEEAYFNAVVNATQLCFRDISVPSLENGFIEEIAHVLPVCSRLQRLVIHNAPLIERDGRRLADALQRCGSLVHIEFFNTSLSGSDASGISSLAQSCTALKYLILPLNSIRDAGAFILANTLTGSAVSVLRLERNNISDNGAQGLACSFAYFASLRCLTLHENFISATCKEAIEVAWDLAGRPQSQLSQTWASVANLDRYAVSTTEFESHGGIFL